MRVYWCRGCHPAGRGGNLGDMLTPLLLCRYGRTVRFAAVERAQVVGAGSVLAKFPRRWRGWVWGTGTLLPDERPRLPWAHVLAVRGALTRAACGLPASTPLGDPGVLVADLLPAERPPATGPLVVPHYVDGDLADRHAGTPVVDICGPVLDTLTAIAGASVVYTSSLHALIAADALGVPHVLVPAATKGGLHKFRDYASALGTDLVPGVERLTDRVAMAKVQAGLRAAVVRLPA